MLQTAKATFVCKICKLDQPTTSVCWPYQEAGRVNNLICQDCHLSEPSLLSDLFNNKSHSLDNAIYFRCVTCKDYYGRATDISLPQLSHGTPMRLQCKTCWENQTDGCFICKTCKEQKPWSDICWPHQHIGKSKGMTCKDCFNNAPKCIGQIIKRSKWGLSPDEFFTCYVCHFPRPKADMCEPHTSENQKRLAACITCYKKNPDLIKPRRTQVKHDGSRFECINCKEVTDIANLWEEHKTRPVKGKRLCASCATTDLTLTAQYNPALKIRNLARSFGRDSAYAYLKEPDHCGICGTTDPGKRDFALDHNHETGKFRGKLCINCNTAIGLLHDDPKLAEALARYLTKNWKASQTRLIK